MPDLTPGAELRTAAALLREHAAWATKGPWWAEDTSPARWGDNPDAEVASADGTLAVLCPEWNGPLNSQWIALLNPDMGPLLADWLEAVATEMTSVDGTEYAYEEFLSWTAAHAVARHVAAMEAATPRPAGQPAAAASHHREQARAEGRAQVIAELRTRATGPMLLRVLDEVAEMFARPSEPARCCMCGSAAVRYRNYREHPFCWPCADGTSPQAKAQIALSIANLDKPARSGGSQDGDHECNGRRPAPEPPPPGDLTR